MRDVKKDDYVIFDEYPLYHNYVRLHMALEGKTPEVYGIEIQGEGK